MADRVIYILQDTGRPDLVKVGKDSGWPIRFRQARSQTPRELTCIALWRYTNGSALNQAEKAAHVGLRPFKTGNNTKEWFIASADGAAAHVRTALGRPADETHAMPGSRSWHNAPPWDAWRDMSTYTQTKVRRRLWVGAEVSETGLLGALKVVHSPYYDGFFTFKPTYACSAFRWLCWWQYSEAQVTNLGNRAVYDLWHRLVTQFGQGPDDAAVGWLRHRDGSPKIDWRALQEELAQSGMLKCDPSAPKPFDAPARDPSNGGVELPFGSIPPQNLIYQF